MSTENLGNRVVAGVPAQTLLSGERTIATGTFGGWVSRLTRWITQQGVPRKQVVVRMDDPAQLMVALVSLLQLGAEVTVVDPAAGETPGLELQRRENEVLLLDKENWDRLIAPVMCLEEDLPREGEEGHLALKLPEPGNFMLSFYGPGAGFPLAVNKADLLALFEQLDAAYAPRLGDALLLLTDTAFVERVIESLWAIYRQITLCLPSAGTGLPDCIQPGNAAPAMDFSLFFFGGSSHATAQREGYALVFDAARLADANGYSAVWTPERHFDAFGGLFPNPSVLGAALAMVTSNLQIRTGSLVAPLHHPLRIAEDWSLIDNLSGGRAAVSFASGWQCNDFVFNPGRYADRHACMMEQVEQVRRLWAGESVPYKNGLGVDTPVRIYPKPVQPELPIWITVSGKTETFADAGRIGANILTHLLWQNPDELIEKIQVYRHALRENGFDPRTRTVSVMIHTFLGESDEEVIHTVKKPLTEYIRSSVHLIEAMTGSVSATVRNQVGRYGNVDGGIPAHLLDELLEIAFDRFFSNAALLGSADRCHRVIEKLHKYGVDELACLIDFGVGHAEVMAGLERLNALKKRYGKDANGKVRITLVRGNTDSLQELGKDQAGREILTAARKIACTGAPPGPLCALAGEAKAIGLSYGPEGWNAGLRIGQPAGCRPGSAHPAPVNARISEDF